MTQEIENKIDKLADAMQQGFSEVHDQFNKIDSRFEQIDSRFVAIEEKLNNHDKHFDSMATVLDNIAGRLDHHDTESAAGMSLYTALSERLNLMEQQMAAMK